MIIAAEEGSSTMQVKEAVHGRRAVRDYTDQPVEKVAVTALVQAAIQAPSAINQQPWAFVVIQDKALLKVYSDRAKVRCAETMKTGSMPEELKAMLSDPSFNIFYNSGTLIVIWAKPIGQHPDWDCCLAAENLMLAAHDIGLGTCPIGLAWPLLEQPEVKNELNVPFDYVPVMPMLVGYPRKPAPSVERNEPEIRCWK
jgi:nitroreductase